MREILHSKPLPLIIGVFGLQVLAFLVLILGTWGGGGPILGLLMLAIFVCEILCIVFLSVWLWYMATQLSKELNARGIHYNLSYFKTFYITLQISVTILLCLMIFGIFSSDALKLSSQNILRSEYVGSITGFSAFIIPYLFGGCIFYLMLFLLALDKGREATVVEFILLAILSMLTAYSLLLIPVIFYYIQKKALAYIES